MKTLHIIMGLPRSGKSTYARTLGFPRVELDAIRYAVHGTAWRPESEMLIRGLAHTMVRALFNAGHENVIVDATHHTSELRAQWISEEWTLRFHVIDTLVDTCIERARMTDQEYLIPVINRMSANWEPLQGSDN